MCFKIPPDVFYPKPKVDSAIIKFSKKKRPLVQDENYVKFNKIVKTAFSKRRKMLRNSELFMGQFAMQELQQMLPFLRFPEKIGMWSSTRIWMAFTMCSILW
jgi:16S rRNA (adenine1518-N6/adenine1519-N6)-dimethyltransferase